MSIHESGENYLEAILVLSKERELVRSVDVAAFLEVTKPSVSRAMSILKDSGYIETGDGGALILTEKGLAVADSIYERHRLLTKYLVSIGVDQQVAADDACKIEHVISEESFAKLKEHVERCSADK